ncbi:MAG: class I mannose-6-phosphate isomerase [Chitinispirillales bacterium]|jgi:mannose-6-phosphate isomerase|nr:class I mannose-6-phosphate isomerase [Chitinispirillales bacterium]
MSGLFPTPLRFEPIFKEKIWGGAALREKLNKGAPAGRPIGESWEVSGWGDSQTVVSTGEYMGLTLGELFSLCPADLIGTGAAAGKNKGFPLLFKFIDARENLSIQVHPNSEQAQKRGWGERGKTEAWYVADADPGARIALGFNRGDVTREEAAEAAEKGRFESLLNFVPARRGDAFFIPAGTVHAILGGVLIYEVQEESNTTLRLYDWNRKCSAGNLRELHIADALDIINFNENRTLTPKPVVVDKGEAFVRETICDNKKFLLSRYSFSKSGEASMEAINGFRVITVTAGLTEAHANGHRVQMGLGQTVLIPSGLENVRIVGVAGSEALVTTG